MIKAILVIAIPLALCAIVWWWITKKDREQRKY
jgi:cbb3-type cytochrome oxidase subunit 3